MNSLLQTLRNLGPTRLALMGGVGLVIIGFFVFLLTRAGGGNQAMLYGNLQPNDSTQIAAMLDQKGIPYELRANGAEIWVKQDQVASTRLQAGQSGLPGAGASIGKEIFDKSDALGSTSFLQKQNEIRALEGELSRSIKTLAMVDQVRVHLVLPQRELFSREQREASASVVLKLKNRAKMAPEQTQAIQQLVAAAVPGLKPTRISVVDDRGITYSSGIEDQTNIVQVRAEEQKRLMETRLARQIEEIVGATEGLDNVRAMVSAEMDFNKETTNEERFDPDQQVARSVQEVTEEAESTETQGEDPVTVAQNLPDANAAITTGAGSFSRSTRTESTTNFEISRIIKTHERVTGKVTRLSVAVVLNGNWTQQGQYIPRTEQEMTEFRDVIEKAVGIAYDRGDQLTVLNRQFPRTVFDDDKLETILGIPKADLFKILEMLVLGVVAVLVILLVARPLIARALEATDEEGLIGSGLPDRPGSPALAGPDLARRMDESAEMEALEQMIDINQVEGRVRASSLRKIGEIVDKHPEEAVAILRNWMYQEA